MKIYIIIAGLISMLAPAAIDLYLPALQDVANAFNTTMGSAEKTISFFLAGFAAGQILWTSISQTIGYRAVLIFGLLVFFLFSLAIVNSSTMEQFYAFRFFQAVGGASSVVIIPMIKDSFSELQSRVAISYLMACIVIAPVLAPSLGALLLSFSSWQGIFLVLAAFSIVLVVPSFIITKKTPHTDTTAHLNIFRIFLEYKNVMTSSPTLLPILCGSLSMGALFSYISGSAFVYVEYYHISTGEFALVLSANASAMILINLINGKFLNGYCPIRKVFAGSLGMIISAAALGISAYISDNLLFSILSSIGFFISLGLVETNSVIQAYALNKKSRAIAACLGVLQFALGAIGSYAISSISTQTPYPLSLTLVVFSAACFVISLIMINALTRNSRRYHIAIK